MKMYRTAPFIRLGRMIDSILPERPAVFDELVRLARSENPWFTADSIRLSLQAMSQKMLDREKLESWLERYPRPAHFEPRNVGIVMAGNIPLVGFLDLLCVCISGHRAYVKTSSKDTALMKRAIAALATADRSLTLLPLTEDSPLDAVIATGSDNTNRYFKRKYGSMPGLLRKNRTSIAVLGGEESPEELRGLTQDVFDYFGMGCRSVSRFFLPENYKIGELLHRLQERNVTHPNYRNAYRHQKAMLHMQSTDFLDGGFFTLREHSGFSEALPDLVFSRYRDPAEVEQWIEAHEDSIQCVVTRTIPHPRAVAFGMAQQPELWDYPDGKDVMAFLYSLE
ncbi:MAG: acyl-CoA reductase [Rikenellaceae bacterium]|nr:acyl-CoA reductase [Rikenellaceae bacterium]